MASMEKDKQRDYLKILFPEISEKGLDIMLESKEKYSSFSTKRVAINFPDIDSTQDNNQTKSKEDATIAPIDATGSNTPDITQPTESPIGEPFPQLDDIQQDVVEDTDKEDALSIALELQDLKNEFQNLEREVRLNDLKEDITYEVSKIVKGLRKEIDDFKARKVPQRAEYDTEGAYKEQLYPLVVNVLDNLLLSLVDIVPDYNLIATQVSDVYEDGSIKNGIVTISVIIPYNDYKHEFKVDIPVLNGLIQSPQYMTRGRTIVPFTEEGIYSEITKESFVKLSPYYKKKDNLFSNSGENPLRKHDDQKVYPTADNSYNEVDMGQNRWVNNKQRSIENE